MKILTESKHVGPIYYIVGSIDILEIITRTEEIKTSVRPELPHRDMNHVSFTRDWRNQNSKSRDKWKYGLQIDGTKLSNRYSIEPYSYAGTEHSSKGALHLEVKYLTSYDNGQYRVGFVNWGSMSISKEFYEELESRILRQPESFNQKCKLKIQQGGRRIVPEVGGKIVIKYLYNTKQGGVSISINEIPKDLLKGTSFNEREERIWTKDQTINISGCITGVILPKNAETTTDPDVWEDISKYIENNNLEVITY